MNYTNKLNEHFESDITGIEVDYDANKKFFDKKRRQKVGAFYTISVAGAALGGLFVYFAVFLNFGILYIPGWTLIVAGAVLACIALAKTVRESDVTDIFDVKKKQFDDICGDKIGWPDDIENMSMSFMGCNITADNIDKMYKLKDGKYIDTEIVLTFIYVDHKKQKLFIAEETYSLLEPKDSVKFIEIPYSGFDGAEILTEKITDKISLYRGVISDGGAKVFDFPFSDNDFSKEEFIGGLPHYKELRRDF